MSAKGLFRKERSDFLIADDFPDTGIEVAVLVAVGDWFDLDRESLAFCCENPGLQQAEEPSVF
jgi:hypothetical protein